MSTREGVMITWLLISLAALLLVARAALAMRRYQQQRAMRYLIAVLLGAVLDDSIIVLLSGLTLLDRTDSLRSFVLLTVGRLARVIPIVFFALYLEPLQRRKFYQSEETMTPTSAAPLAKVTYGALAAACSAIVLALLKSYFWPTMPADLEEPLNTVIVALVVGLASLAAGYMTKLQPGEVKPIDAALIELEHQQEQQAKR